jgi:hypothetical protein
MEGVLKCACVEIAVQMEKVRERDLKREGEKFSDELEEIIE